MKTFEESLAVILDAWEDKFTTQEERIRQEVALETAELLRNTSPKKSGEYAAGWTAQNNPDGSVVVYNAAKPSLTHLLEYGHANPTAITGRKRTPAKPHIQKAETWADAELKRRLKEL